MEFESKVFSTTKNPNENSMLSLSYFAIVLNVFQMDLKICLPVFVV